MPDSVDAMRRWLGAFCLAVAAGMLIWGQTVLVPFLRGIGFLLYWFLCFFFTFAAIWFALLDVRAVRHRIKSEQADLLQRTLEEIERGTPSPSDDSDHSTQQPRQRQVSHGSETHS